MSGPFSNNLNGPGHGLRSLANRTVRPGQTAPRNEKQYVSLGDFLQSHTSRDAKDKPLLREAPNLHNLTAFVGEHQLEKLREFTESAGSDLVSKGPQTNPAFLKALLEELGKLKQITTVFGTVKEETRFLTRANVSLDELKNLPNTFSNVLWKEL